MLRIVFLSFFLCFNLSLSAGIIDSLTARYIASNFFRTKLMGADTPLLSLVYSQEIAGLPTFYVFANADSGFVIVSATDNNTPILAYSKSSSFEPDNIPPSLAGLLQSYKVENNYLITNNIPATPVIMREWKALMNKNCSVIQATKTTAVAPLLHTTWNQNQFYNYLCPTDPVTHKKALTGCVATVMGQIMKYWKWPIKGIGSHTYSDSVFGVQYADFSKSNYQWNSMPNRLSNNNLFVDTLLYHAGVSVNMEYGINSSSSYVLSAKCPIKNSAQYALINYFCYKPTMRGVYRKDFSDVAWLNLLETEITAGRPVIYDGANDSEGHSFIANGFDNNNLIYFNWGWGGAFDGYFSIFNIVPDSINLMKNQEVLVGIEPDTARSIIMGDTTSTVATIYQGQPFTLQTKVININENKFIGTFMAKLSDDYNTWNYSTQYSDVDTLKWDDSLVLYFQFNNMLPGYYHAQIFYQPTNLSATLAASSPNDTNFSMIAIYGNNNVTHCTVFPNPATEYLFVNLNHTIATAYRLLDLRGRVWHTEQIKDNPPVLCIPVNFLPKGDYLVEITENDGNKESYKFCR